MGTANTSCVPHPVLAFGNPTMRVLPRHRQDTVIHGPLPLDILGQGAEQDLEIWTQWAPQESLGQVLFGPDVAVASCGPTCSSPGGKTETHREATCPGSPSPRGRAQTLDASPPYLPESSPHWAPAAFLMPTDVIVFLCRQLNKKSCQQATGLMH